MRRALLLAPLLLPLAARAQPAPPVYPGPGTALRLSETADVIRTPDEVRAVLRIETREGTAATVQSAVNRVMAAALEAARAVPGVVAATGAYRTWRDPTNGRWTASQTLNLRGPDAAALLELTGALQSRGLATDNITFALTNEAVRTARQEAASLALDALRRRAEAVAAQLGMRVERIAEVRIGGGEVPFRPVPGPLTRAASVAAAIASPSAQSDDIVVPATVEAVVVLAPN